MHKAATPGMTGPILLAALAGLALASCGEKFSGTYLAQGKATYPRIEFVSGDAVKVTAPWGTQIVQGTYKMDGEKLVITGVALAPLVFTVDDKGCLTIMERRGTSIGGKYCKQSDAAPQVVPANLSGNYLPAGAGMTSYAKLEFEAPETVDMTPMLGPTMRGTYKLDGKKVVITVAGASLVYTMDDRGCVTGGMGDKYCKK